MDFTAKLVIQFGEFPVERWRIECGVFLKRALSVVTEIQERWHRTVRSHQLESAKNLHFLLEELTRLHRRLFRVNSGGIDFREERKPFHIDR